MKPQMSWNFRRSIRFGLFRVNLSRSGIGYSVGARGIRVGRDAKKRSYEQLSIPNTGIYRRSYGKSGILLSRPKMLVSFLAMLALYLLIKFLVG
jgi:hypothetical protein